MVVDKEVEETGEAGEGEAADGEGHHATHILTGQNINTVVGEQSSTKAGTPSNFIKSFSTKKSKMCKNIKKLTPKLGHVKNKYKTVHKPKPTIIPGKIHNKVTNSALSKVDDKIVEKGNRLGTNKIPSGKITTKNMVKSPIKRTPTKNTIKSKENTIKKRKGTHSNRTKTPIRITEYRYR